MTTDPADLASLLTRAATSNSNQPLLSGMGQPGSTTQVGQGRILSWNPSTFENTVAFRGGVLTNLPVLSGPDALTYKADDVVSIMSLSPNGGVTTHWIQGRVIFPGPGRGEQAVEWMTSELGRRIAAAVFAERIKSDEDPNTGIRDAAGWGDLEPVTVGPPPPLPGPTVNLEVSPAGVALVFLTSRISPALVGGSGVLGQFGQVGVEVSGATTLPAQFGDSLMVELQDTDPDTGVIIGCRATAVVRIADLNQGPTTFKMVYSSGSSDDREQVVFESRNITAIGL